MGSFLTTDNSCDDDPFSNSSGYKSTLSVLPSLDKCNTIELIETIKKYSGSVTTSSTSSTSPRENTTNGIIKIDDLKHLIKVFQQFEIIGKDFLQLAKDYLNNKTEDEILITRNEIIKNLNEKTNLDLNLLENCIKLIIEKKIKEDVEEYQQYKKKKQTFEKLYNSFTSKQTDGNEVEKEKDEENLFGLSDEQKEEAMERERQIDNERLQEEHEQYKQAQQ
ncbi:hypothetical protein ABK040_006284 [Willaertia magna]